MDGDKKYSQSRQNLFAGFLLLTKLSPAERAIFLLKEGFDFAHHELSQLLETLQDYCQQLYHRDGERLKSGSRLNLSRLKNY